MLYSTGETSSTSASHLKYVNLCEMVTNSEPLQSSFTSLLQIKIKKRYNQRERDEGGKCMFDISKLQWTPEPLPCKIEAGRIEMTTHPRTDLWQKTFADFSSDNAPVLQTKTSDQHFTFRVKTSFDTKGTYDQCGLVMHLNANTWLKASIERETAEICHLGSVATNHGYSDWACCDVSPDVSEIWYQLTRKGSDFTLEYSFDGKKFSMLRMCHMWDCEGEISFGVYACSPQDSSFAAVFSDMDYQKLSDD